ncbi:uncharacterized protein [Diadema antillarum]|uniref:uncharacterized protein n=1 Tax=Diadema antillarum TaxID=105358 RepID=UPI003A8A064C
MASLRKVYQNLNCPLCTDIFEEATLLNCGHTFCRKCLVKYDEFHPDCNDMLCPLCQEPTPLTEQRVGGLSSNATLRGVVGDCKSLSVTQNSRRRLHQTCNLCKISNERSSTSRSNSSMVTEQPEAVSFCYDCDGYLCESCYSGHTRMVSLFGDHRIVPIEEMVDDASDDEFPMMCGEHKTEQLGFYCQDCEDIACPKCKAAKHGSHDHAVKDLAQYEHETRQKIDMLVMRSSVRTAKISKHISDIEQERRYVRSVVARINAEIKHSYEEKRRRLEENRARILKEVSRVETIYNGRLSELQVVAAKLSRRISVSNELISKGKRKLLRGESRVAHGHLYQELDQVLSEEIDMAAPGRLRDVTSKTCFVPAPRDSLDLGQIGAHVTGWTVDNEFDIPGDDAMNGLARMDYDKVAISYYNGGVDSFDVLTGHRTMLIDTDDRGTHDVAFLSDGRFVVTNTRRVLRLFNADKSPTETRYDTPSDATGLTMLAVDHDDNILLSYWELKKIYVFSSAGGRPLRIVETDREPRQVHPTTTGVIVTQRLSNVSLIDESGGIVWSVTKRKGYLYPAISDGDQLYIACVRPTEGTLSIEHYTLGGKHLGTVVKNVRIKTPSRHWYYMTFLSPSCIAFCTAGRIYVIRKSLTRTKILSDIVSPRRIEVDTGVKICKTL